MRVTQHGGGPGDRPSLTLIATLLLVCMSVARADSHDTIEAMHPSADATLGRNGTFHVLIAYHSDEPISLWARPFRDGQGEAAVSQ